MAKTLDKPRGAICVLNPRSDDAIGARVQDRAEARGVRAREADESAGVRRPASDGERLDVADPERTVLEVDPDEVDGLGDKLREGDTRHAHDRAEDRLARPQPAAHGPVRVAFHVVGRIIQAPHKS